MEWLWVQSELPSPRGCLLCSKGEHSGAGGPLVLWDPASRAEILPGWRRGPQCRAALAGAWSSSGEGGITQLQPQRRGCRPNCDASEGPPPRDRLFPAAQADSLPRREDSGSLSSGSSPAAHCVCGCPLTLHLSAPLGAGTRGTDENADTLYIAVAVSDKVLCL